MNQRSLLQKKRSIRSKTLETTLKLKIQLKPIGLKVNQKLVMLQIIKQMKLINKFQIQFLRKSQVTNSQRQMSQLMMLQLISCLNLMPVRQMLYNLMGLLLIKRKLILIQIKLMKTRLLIQLMKLQSMKSHSKNLILILNQSILLYQVRIQSLLTMILLHQVMSQSLLKKILLFKVMSQTILMKTLLYKVMSQSLLMRQSLWKKSKLMAVLLINIIIRNCANVSLHANYRAVPKKSQILSLAMNAYPKANMINSF